jgi:DNA-binding response OmpR family regulator
MNKNNKKILIAEDEEPMLAALAKKFEKAGFTVLTAVDGESALETAIKNHPDLLLLDILMPKLDGISLLKKIRQESRWGEEVPILMLTNLSDPQNVSEAANYGVFDFLVKTDWRLDDVVELVKNKLGLN